MSPAANLLLPVLGGCAVIVWRLRETSRPISLKGIVLPPLAMSTGFAMFAYPPTRVPWAWGLAAFLLGAAVFAHPLINSSKLSSHHGEVYLKRSKTFLWVLLGLLSVRILLRGYVEHLVSPLQTASLFYLLAFGMILRWRAGMVLAYRRLHSSDT